ncbi:hypothetical protein M5K25_020722 [Dendrobium thyrsiflorum]|uniref:Uncharacterized protein n=1 Tax=Dendrobium thyrsiflorum TaxID=117978 RepID=A0ABD0UI07_DENTH
MMHVLARRLTRWKGATWKDSVAIDSFLGFCLNGPFIGALSPAMCNAIRAAVLSLEAAFAAAALLP